MNKKIIYTIINLATAVLLFFFFRLNDNEEDYLLLFIVIIAFIALLLIVVQFILLITYGLNSNKNYDFLLVFTSVYSVLFIIPYIVSIIAFFKVRNTILEMSEELISGFGKEAYDEMLNDNPFWGIHAILLIPIGVQTVIFILRIKRNTNRVNSNTF